jgi:hypothetical protein
MQLSKPATRGVRLLLAALLVIATVVAVSAAAEHPALAASPCALSSSPAMEALGAETSAEATYFIGASACSGTDVPASHACMAVFTGDFGDQAVQCADVAISISSSGEVDVWTDGSFYCQDSGLEACAWISVQDQLGYKDQVPENSLQFVSAITGYGCNMNCTGSKAHVGSGHLETTNTGNETCIEAWGVDLSRNEVQDPISPIDDITSGNFSSHHVNLCFG